MTVRGARMGELVNLSRERVQIEAVQTYRTLGLLNHGRGVFARESIFGSETKYPHYFRVKSGQLIYSKLFGWEGSVAIVPPEYDGYYVSPEFPTFDVDMSLMLPSYVDHLVKWSGFTHQLASATTGMGQRRQRVNIDAFEAIEVPLPSILNQRRIADHLGKMTRLSRLIIASDDVHVSRLTTLVEGAIRTSLGQSPSPIAAILERERDWFDPAEDQSYSPIGIRGFGRGIIHYPGVPRGELGKLRYYRVQPERILVSNIKAWEGAVTVTTEADQGRIASNRFLQYRLTSHDTSIGWIRAYLLSRAGIAQLQDASPGSADRNWTLSMDAFESIVVPLPSLEQQAAVLALADRATELALVRRRRLALAGAILPAARNEVFSALR